VLIRLSFRPGVAASAVICFLSLFSTTVVAESVEHMLYSFSDCAVPYAPVIADGSGNLYGTTYGGGAYGMGCVFKLSLNQDGSWSETNLYSFDGTIGNQPMSPVVFDSSGNLYGTATGGGPYGNGVVFELSPSANGEWTQRILHNFGGAGDGSYPLDLTFDQDGNIFGTTLYGGTENGGIVYKLSRDKDGWTETILRSFPGDGMNGCQRWQACNPGGGVVLGPDGTLYGTSFFGGTQNIGTAFELSPRKNGTYRERIIYSFHGTDGAGPDSTLILDSRRNLYGTTISGGNLTCDPPYGCGTVFQLTSTPKSTWSEHVLLALDDNTGNLAWGPVVFDRKGNLYGMADTGVAGSGMNGSVFKLTPNSDGSWALTVLHKFPFYSRQDGRAPVGITLVRGKLLGTTWSGGENDVGTLFEIDLRGRDIGN
jgi:uncharacterized repeat protein (TIGR03803 family)